MKKIFLIALFLIAPFVQAREETPILIDNGAFFADVVEEPLSEIDVDCMKKRKEIKQAQDEILKDSNPRKIKLDTRQINRQRALDYTTRQNNSMLPVF